MSDIGFYGLLAALTGAAMLAVATAGALVEGIVWRSRRGRRPNWAGRSVFLGPVVYAGLGMVLLLSAEWGSLEVKSAMDTVAPFAAIGGVAAWAALRLRFARAPRALEGSTE